jgi:hypothetical protein
MEPKVNENCLAGVRCPDCGNTESFRVVALVWTVVGDDGAVLDPEDMSMDYEPDSVAICRQCGKRAWWTDFHEEEM